MEQQPTITPPPSQSNYYRNENPALNSIFLRLVLDVVLLICSIVFAMVNSNAPGLILVGLLLAIVAVVRIVQNRQAAKKKGFRGDLHKIDDFFLGLLIVAAVGFLLPAALSIVAHATPALPLLLLLIVIFATLWLSFTKGRHYIGIGFLSVLVIPFLAFGACLVLLAGSPMFR